MERLAPAVKGGGFTDPDHWIWCGSPIQGEDGRFHLFASRWPRRYPMAPHWLLNSQIVRAVSDSPEGPYAFQEVVLSRRGSSWFDGMNTHNPSIRFFEGTYYLYYFGATYEGPPIEPETVLTPARYNAIWNTKRIGLATSRSVFGPWKRPDRPLLLPRQGMWDCTATTNPSAAILADGRTYMLYKSRAGDGATLRLGVAVADHPAGPYRRLTDDPIFRFDDPDLHVEDPCLWHEDGLFHILIKDDFKNDCGGLTGEWGAGVYGTSEDCIHWDLHGKAYSRTVRWDDGTTTVQANVERPNLLFQNGRPTHLFCATGDGPQPWHFHRTWNMCIPLKHLS